MSDQDMEMQFADPDWQPASSRQGRSPAGRRFAEYPAVRKGARLSRKGGASRSARPEYRQMPPQVKQELASVQ